MFNQNKDTKKIKLFVRRVLISDDLKDIIPDWLSFVCGVIDCDDLPLNVSREMLQDSSIMQTIKKNLVKKCIDLVSEVAEDDEKYKTFYKNFSNSLKLGVHEDDKNRDKLVKLLRFNSSTHESELRSLDQYIESMTEEQKDIYYITGENLNMVQNSPFIEQLSKKNREVLYMTDTIDEYIMQHIKEYESKKLVCITKENLELDSNVDIKEYEKLCSKIKEILSDKVENVKISNRIVDSPSCLVTSDTGWSANMERIMNAQALGNNDMHGYMKSKKIMELNADHKIIKELNKRVNIDDNDKVIRQLSELLYDLSLIRSGFTVENSKLFASRLTRMIELGLCLDDEEEEAKQEENKEEEEAKQEENKEEEEKENKEEEEENKEKEKEEENKEEDNQDINMDTLD